MNESCVRAPIVLVHGILGFTEVRLGSVKIGDYFRDIREALQADGNTVPAPPQLNPAGSVAERAQDLKHYLETDLSGQQVHLIAHSMGGLDSRHLISRLGMADRVLTLTTLGTPHRGTPFADEGTETFGLLLDALLSQGINLRGFLDLTTAACANFNQETLDAPDVRYYSVAGQFDPSLVDILKLPHDIILKTAGPNDGLVPVSSATYGHVLGVWTCDHFRLINWATNLVTPPSELVDTTVVDGYRAVVRHLAGEEF